MDARVKIRRRSMPAGTEEANILKDMLCQVTCNKTSNRHEEAIEAVATMLNADLDRSKDQPSC